MLSTTISPNITSHNTQSTDHDKTPPLKQNASANDTPNGSRIPEAGPTQDNHKRKRPVGSQWEP
eukprot:scaffold11383_cov123-Isochrysis_galbana.AAC.2